MKQLFSLYIFFIFISGLAMAQEGDSKETRLEQAMALYAEQLPSINHIPPISNSVLQVTHPLFIGVDDVTVPAYVGNPTTNEWLQAFTGYTVWGAAYDNINDKIYFNSGTTLNEWEVSSGIVTTLGTITDPGGAAQSMVALAFYGGVLYGTKNIAPEAVYIIDPSTLIATVYIDYDDPSYDFGGLAADPSTGELYGTSDTSPPGLYRINLNGTATMIVDYPTGQTDIDGLTISDAGIAYLVIDEPGNIYVYDLIGGTYLAPLTNPWTTSETFSAGAWNAGIIPVELTSLTASVTGNNVKLLWETATELNNSGFSVERKTSNSEFAEVGFVPGFGTTTERKSYSFVDKDLNSGNYTYRLKQIDFNGTYEYYGNIEVDVTAPAEFNLNQNYPNPFNPSTKITFSLAVDSKVSLKVFNVLGQEVATLVNQDLTAGVHNYVFDAANINSGVYFYQIEATGVNGVEFTEVKKMILAK
jgi:hypothetical protein